MPDLTDPELDQLINTIGLRPRKGPGARAACGTPSGYERHRKNGEDACEPCKKANTEYKTQQTRRAVVAPDKLKPIAHGTLAGYKQHRYRREDACEDCKRAAAEYQRKTWGLKRRQRAKPGTPVCLTEAEWQERAAARRTGDAR